MEHDQLIGEMTQIERFVIFLSLLLNLDHLLQADNRREAEVSKEKTGHAVEALGAEGKRVQPEEEAGPGRPRGGGDDQGELCARHHAAGGRSEERH